MTVTDAPGLATAGNTPDTTADAPTVVSGTSPLAADFRSRFFTAADYRRFHARAPRYDSENTFFTEDFAELVGTLRQDISRHAQKPAVQRQVAQAEIKLEAAAAFLESVTGDQTGDAAWSPLRALAAKEYVTTTAREVVEIAVQVVGASSVSKRHELERLYRDVRTGSLHPPNTDAVLEILGATALGQN